MALRKIGNTEQITLDQAAPEQPRPRFRKLEPSEDITLDADRAVLPARATSPVYYPKQEEDTSLLGHVKSGATDATRSLYALSANLMEMGADKAEAIETAARIKYYDIFGYPERDPQAENILRAPEGNVVSRALREQAEQDFRAERMLRGREEAMNVQDTVSWEDVKADPLSLKTGRFILEQGARSAPEMAVAAVPYVGLPAVMGTTTQRVLEERNIAQGRDATALPTGEDLTTALAFAAPSAALERIGVKGSIAKPLSEVTRARQIPGAMLRSGAGEAATEFIQENLELAGATTGTDVDPTLQERLETGLQGALVGGPMGATIRGVTEGVSVARKEKPAPLMLEDGRTDQNLGTDSQEQQVAAQVEVPLNREDLKEAIEKDTDLPETKTVDLPQVDIDPALQEQGFVVGANVEQVTPEGEVISGTVTTAQSIDDELEVTIIDEAGQLRTLFESDGDLLVTPLEQQVDPDIDSPALEEEIVPAPPPPVLDEPISPPVERPVKRKEPENPFEEMDVQQLTNVLSTIKDQAKQAGWNKMLTERSRQVREQLDTRFPEWDAPTKVDIESAAQDVNTDPTDAQKESGNYKKGHVSIQGMPVTLENPKGSLRTGTDQGGAEWSVQMPAHYGYIKKTKGADGEQIDVYIGESPSSDKVFVLDQIDADSQNFDEHKAFIGFESANQVKDIYNKAFDDARAKERYGGLTEMTVSKFKEWLKTSQKKPLKYKKPAPQEFVPTGHNIALDLMGEYYNNLPNEKKGDFVMIAARYKSAIDKDGKPDKVASRIVEAIDVAQMIGRYADEKLSGKMLNLASSMAKRYSNAIYENMNRPVQTAKIKADEQRLSKMIDSAHDFMDKSDAKVSQDTRREEKPQKEAEIQQDVESGMEAQKVDAPPADDIPLSPVEDGQDKKPVKKPAKKETAETVGAQDGKKKKASEKRPKDQETVKKKSDVGKIKDFGEKIKGAKKDLWQSYDKTLTSTLPDELAKISLAKHFPEPNYEKFIEAGVSVEILATVKALRDQIKSKPRKSWRLKQWADDVRKIRELSHKIISDGAAYEAFKGKGEEVRQLGDFFDRIEFYKELGYPAFVKAKNWKVFTTTNFERNPETGKLDRKPTGWRASEKSRFGTQFDTKKEAIDYVRSQLLDDKGEKKERKTKLDIYRVTKTGDIIIGKKVGPNKFIDLKTGFSSSRDARTYLSENYDSLLDQLKKKKEIAPIRRSINDPRIGEDYRAGKNISPEEFSDTFGFRGVQFGNYVEQKKRVQDLNNAYDALTDLAKIIEIPSKAVSLDGGLGLAFGARGRGGKNPEAAHYEEGDVVINLTKRSGAGSLGHEWFHSLDNYFGKKNKSGFLTQRPYAADGFPVRKEVVEAYNNIVRAIAKTDIKKRSKRLDKLRAKDYWSSNVEMTARSFESYLIHKANEKGGRNDYLANISSREAFESVMGDGTYPYPLESEMPIIIEAYDKLFDTIKTKHTDTGVALYRRSPQTRNFDNNVSKKVTDAINSRLETLGWPQANFVIYNSPDQLGQLTGLDETVQGFYWRGIIHVAANAPNILGAINHEIVHALKKFGAFTDGEWNTLESKASKWREKYDIDKNYAETLKAQGVEDVALLERKLNEEAIAEAFRDFSNKGPVRRIANRAVRFIKAIGNVLKGKPFYFQSAEDVFQAIDTGKIGERIKKQDQQQLDDFPQYMLGKSKKTALDTAQETLAEVKGLETSLTDDLKRVSAMTLHPQQIATLFSEFTPVYQAVIDRNKQREVLLHQLSKNIDLYNKMNKESKKKIDAVLEIGRLDGKTYTPDSNGTITVSNKGLENTVHSNDGDIVFLSPTESAAYLGVRRTMDMALDKYMESILEEYGLLERGVKSIQDVEKLRLQAAKEGNTKAVRDFKDILQRLNDVKDAKKRGYIPFKRWGEIGVSVKNKDGDVVYFEKIELPRRIIKKRSIGEYRSVQEAEKRLGKKFNKKDYSISFFEMNKFDKVAANIDLKSLDILASSSEMSDADYRILREMLQKEMQKKGFRSHFFRSKDVPGYSDDFERAINDYVVTISSYISRRMNEQKIDSAVSEIADSGKAKLYDYAQNYQKYVNDPQEELAVIRMAGFFWYLAGNISSGLVNTTQPFLVTAPWFKAKFSHAQIGKALTKAYSDVAKISNVNVSGEHFFDFKKAPSDIREALIKAQEKGDFLSMATHDAMAISNSNTQALRGFQKRKRAVAEAIALTFSIPERINRVATFSAAYRLALDPKNQQKIKRFLKDDKFGSSLLEGKTGKDFAFAYAEYAVVSTQYRVGKLNRPSIARGYGTLVFQFWSFMTQTLELMYKLSKVHGGKNKSALAVMLLSLIAVAGLKGVPFEDDMQEIIEGLYKFRTGKDLDIDTKVREFISDKTNPFVAESLMRGLPASLLNVDLSNRLGFGNVAPDMGSDMLGVWFDMFYDRPMRAAGYANEGEIYRAITEVMPAFVKNPMTAYSWAEDGIRTQKGAKVIDAGDVQDIDVALKFFGFTSGRISRKRDELWATKRAGSAVNELRTRYYKRVAKAIAERKRLYDIGDSEGARQMTDQIESIKSEINRHNQTHDVHERIILRDSTIKKRVLEELEGAKSKKVRKQARQRKKELEEIFEW